jgi:hypothetical protein
MQRDCGTKLAGPTHRIPKGLSICWQVTNPGEATKKKKKKKA